MTARVAKAILLLLPLWGLPPLSRGDQQPQSAVEKSLAAAARDLQAGNFREAEKIYVAAAEEASRLHDPRLGSVLNNLAMVYMHEGEQAKAIECMKQALAADEAAFGAGSSSAAMDLQGLAMDYGPKDQADAEKCFQRAFEILNGLPEPRRSQRFIVVNNLSQFYVRQNRYREAEELLKSAIEDLQKSPPPNGTELAQLERVLASVYAQEGNANESGRAEGDVDEALQPGANPHMSPLDVTLKRADHYRAAGNLEAAEASYREAIAALETGRADKTHGPDYPGALPYALEGLGEVCVAEKRDAEAEELFNRAFDLCEQDALPGAQGEAFARNLAFPVHLYNLYQAEGRLNEMEPIFARALAAEEKVLGPQDSAIGQTSLRLAQLYCEERKYQEALPLYRRAMKIQEKNEGETPTLAFTLEDYARLLDDLGDPESADAARARAKSIRLRTEQKSEKPLPNALPFRPSQ